MNTCSCKSVLIDLFNLPPLPDKHNTKESYMDVPHNYYIPDGKNSRLLDRTDMLTADQRTKVYEDRFKVIAEMAKSFYIFSRSIFFNLEMADQYTVSRDKYFNYFTQIVRNLNIFLQEDQLMHTKAGFSLVPVPGYLPNSNDLEQRNADQIS